MSQESGSQRRTSRAGELRQFAWHTVAFVLVNTFIIIQDLATGGGLDWASWVFVPWGIGLLAHAVAVFVLSPSWMDEKLHEMEEKEHERAGRSA